MTNPTPELDMSGQTPPPKKGAESSSGGPFAGLIQWLGDSYNGLYKIVLEPSMPRRYQVYLIIFGAILGLIWAWGLYPVVFTGANPERLNQSAQDQWVKMVAVAVSDSIKYDEIDATELLSRVPDPMTTINNLLADPNTGPGDAEALQNLLNILPPDLAGTPAPGQNGLLVSIGQILLLIILIGVLTPIWMLLWRILIYPNVVAGAMDQFKQMTNKEYAEQRKRDEEGRKAAQIAANAKRNLVVEEDVNLGAPVMKTLSIFSAGRDYDDSFEIELPLDQGGDFLGQCGATIAEAVAPDPVAIEMWLFDMFTSQDKKRVFITEAGYNDPSIRARIEGSLESPSDLMIAQNGAKLIVDSDKLRLQGEMKDLQVNANGRFQSFQMPIAAWWRKDGAPATSGTPSGGAAFAPPPTLGSAPSLSDYDDIQFDPPPQPPAGGRSMSDYDDIQFDPPPPAGGRSLSDYDNIQLDPPPAMPGQNPLQPPPLRPPASNQPPPPSIGMQPLQPPPLRNNPLGGRPPEDDPFGGTGDFTPLGDD